jgi:hypothetical protein
VIPVHGASLFGNYDQMPAVEKPLIGQRVVLRELRPTDWHGIHSYASLPEACRYQAWGPNTEEQSRAFCDRQIAAAAEEPRGLYALAITGGGGDAIIGMAPSMYGALSMPRPTSATSCIHASGARVTQQILPCCYSSSDSRNCICIAFTRRAILETSPQYESWKRLE